MRVDHFERWTRYAFVVKGTSQSWLEYPADSHSLSFGFVEFRVSCWAWKRMILYSSVSRTPIPAEGVTTDQTGKVHVWWQKFFPQTFLRKNVFGSSSLKFKSVNTHILEVILSAWDRSVSLNWWLLSFFTMCLRRNNRKSDSSQHVPFANKQQLITVSLFFLSPCATAFTMQHIAGILQQFDWKASTESTSRLWPWRARRRQRLSTSCCAQRILRKQQRTAPGWRNGTTTLTTCFVHVGNWKVWWILSMVVYYMYVAWNKFLLFELNNDIWGGWESE